MSRTELSRRDFSQRLALGTTVPTMAAAAFAMLNRTVDAAPDEGQNADQPEKDEPKPVPEPPESAWLMGLILKRYPDERFTDAAIRSVLGDIGADLARGREMSTFPLANSDEPGFVFRAWRAD